MIRQVSCLQGKVRTEQTANTALHGQLATVQTETAALNKNSPTGTLITCSDLSDFEKEREHVSQRVQQPVRHQQRWQRLLPGQPLAAVTLPETVIGAKN